MRRVVLDTNVWISAILFGGKPAQVVQLALRGQIHIAISPTLKSELGGVLTEKFLFPEDIVETVITEISAFGLLTHPTEKISAVKDDPADDRVLECAVAAKADAIVSGDRHLLNLGSFRGIPILSPQNFLQMPF